MNSPRCFFKISEVLSRYRLVWNNWETKIRVSKNQIPIEPTQSENISSAVIAYGTYINIFLWLTMLPQPKFKFINRKLRAWWDVLSGESLVELFTLYKSSSRTTLRRRDVLVTRVGSLMWLLLWIRIDLPWQPSTPRALVAPGVMTFLVSTSTGYVVTFQTILYACVHMWLMRVFFIFFFYQITFCYLTPLNTLGPRQCDRHFAGDIFNTFSWLKMYGFRLI